MKDIAGILAQMMIESFEEGKRNYAAGVERRDNPYLIESRRAHWFDGWDYAHCNDPENEYDYDEHYFAFLTQH